MAKTTIQECIDQGWIRCPVCNAYRNVDERGDVSTCDNCNDDPPFWNLFVKLD